MFNNSSATAGMANHGTVTSRNFFKVEHPTFEESWLTELWFYVPLDTKQVISETFPKPIFWLDMEKLNLNLTQQKHTFTNQKKCMQHKINKLKQV